LCSITKSTDRVISSLPGRDISAIMRQVRAKNTCPELIFRKALWANGIRYKLYSTNVIGKPDIVIPSKRLAIFIDGDFWHGGQWKNRKLSSLEDQFRKSRSKKYWLNKIRKNMERDCRATKSLLENGWEIIRFWESEIYRNLEGCVNMTLEAATNGLKGNSISFLPRKTFAEFFAGIGLVRLALEKHGWSVAFANDIDQEKYEMYKAQFPDSNNNFILGDIHNISVKQVPSVSLATASFPCNDLSLAGARHGLAGKQSSAFWGFIRVIEEMKTRRPPIVLVENVPGFLTSHKGEDFKDALKALNHLGYDVDSFILDASSFVPQSRQRLFVIGVLNMDNQSLKVMDTQGFYESDIRPKMLSKFIFNNPDIKWRLRNIPIQPERTKELKDIIENLPNDAPEWWSKERAEYLLNQMSPRHREIADRMILEDEWSYGTVFRRIRNGRSMGELRTDGIAGCLRTPRGGSGRQILFKAGKGRYMARLLTPRECARLMGADDYKISVPLNQALFGFGDAVCAPVIEWIVIYYLNPLVNELIRGHPMKAYNN